MKITLCSSASFFNRLKNIQEELERRGHEIFCPHVWDWRGKSEDEIKTVRRDLIRRHFKHIDLSDAIFVANFDKDNIQGYIGGNVLLEMGKAFDKGIPIFLLDLPPQKLKYREEILALSPIVIGKDWDKLVLILKERSDHIQRLTQSFPANHSLK